MNVRCCNQIHLLWHHYSQSIDECMCISVCVVCVCSSLLDGHGVLLFSSHFPIPCHHDSSRNNWLTLSTQATLLDLVGFGIRREMPSKPIGLSASMRQALIKCHR